MVETFIILIFLVVIISIFSLNYNKVQKDLRKDWEFEDCRDPNSTDFQEEVELTEYEKKLYKVFYLFQQECNNGNVVLNKFIKEHSKEILEFSKFGYNYEGLEEEILKVHSRFPEIPFSKLARVAVRFFRLGYKPQ